LGWITGKGCWKTGKGYWITGKELFFSSTFPLTPVFPTILFSPPSLKNQKISHFFTTKAPLFAEFSSF